MDNLSQKLQSNFFKNSLNPTRGGRLADSDTSVQGTLSDCNSTQRGPWIRFIFKSRGLISRM